ncbi:MAG: sulfatase [Verrucomicrobiaceae bacterium]|nr:sulfatase [Verrucomicrobiaceae bacterium]|tara:strand:+ start:1389 stop:2813 length:1425 start_codon:yes stop_codon:yes gene_type:complete
MLTKDHSNISPIHRRSFLQTSGLGIGAVALQSMLLKDSLGSRPGVSGLPDLPFKAKRVIFLCMAGGPSHLETFDYKPKLDELHGKPMPESFTKGQPIAQLRGQQLKVQGHMTKFNRHGENGQLISDYLPWTAKMADDICIINSMLTEQINHDPAHTFMNTGTGISGRPSMGSWINYGLGSESDELPGFVVLTSVGGRNPQPIASRQWGAGFLPGRFQGVEFSSTGDPVNYLKNPGNVSEQNQRHVVDAIKSLDQKRNKILQEDDILTRISAYEMAFKMQTSVPELMDFSNEPRHILDMYGAKQGDGTYASNCLLARRLAERGSRFIHLYHRGWDHHGGLEKYMNICCGLTDKPTWALLTDLKQRDMLKDTLIVWGGEFGRTPMFQGKGGAGRDHHMKGFSMWLAGGGVRGGVTYGATDELGYNSVENIVHIRDLHATMLHLMGIDHKRFTYQYQGLDSRLTGVEEARVVDEIIL